MAPPKSSKQNEHNPWEWATKTLPENVGLREMLLAYRVIGYPSCSEPCRRNCKKNPRCLWGLGEKKWLGPEEPNTNTVEEVDESLRNEGQIVGIQNLGATCYVNSLLQLWFHNPILRPAIFEWEPCETDLENYVPNCPISHLQAMFARLKLSKQFSIDPSPFVRALELNAGEQQDAQEFSKLLMSLIDELLARYQNQTIRTLIKDCFTGQFQYETTCNVCKNKTLRSSVFNELELTVNKNLRESLEQYLKEELLQGSNQYSCGNCNKNQDAQRAIKLISLPPVLNLQLMRFVYDTETKRKKKVLTVMRFPEELDMTEYVAQEFRKDAEKLIYTLTAVLIHNGKSASSGHYIAHIKDINTGAWYDCNDESVEKKSKVSNKSASLVIKDGDNSQQSEVPTNNGNGPTTSSSKEASTRTKWHSSPGAYMLVYTAKQYVDNPRPDPTMHKYLVDLVKREDLVFENELAKTKAEKEYEEKQREERQKQVEMLYKAKPAITATTSKDLAQQSTITNGTQTQNGGADMRVVVKSEKNIDNLDFVPASWISNWLNIKQTEVEEIGHGSILCPHRKLSPPQMNESGALFRIIPSSVADMLYFNYGGQLRLKGKEALCEICVQSTCSVIRRLIMLEQEHKQFVELMKATDDHIRENEGCLMDDNYTGDKVWVSKEDVRSWKKLVKEGIMLSKIQSDLKHESFLFNSDTACEHDQLIPNENVRKLISVEAWSILQKYFPQAPYFVGNCRPCWQCKDISNANSQLAAQCKNLAQQQKIALNDLFYDKNRPKLDWNNGELYAVPKTFVDDWKRFVRSPSSNTKIEDVGTKDLLCDEHKGIKYPPDLVSQLQEDTNVDEFVMAYLRPEEWNFIKENYKCEYEIKIMSDTDDHNSIIFCPGICEECSVQWYSEMISQSLDYPVSDIYIEKKDDDTKPASPADFVPEEVTANWHVPPKRVKKDEGLLAATALNGTRRSTRAKHSKNQKKYQVTSNTTLRDLQLRIMHDYKAMMSDQHLFQGDYELTKTTSDREKTLGELRVRPGSTLILKVDLDVTKEENMDVDTPPQERGFSGTILQGALNGVPMPMEY